MPTQFVHFVQQEHSALPLMDASLVERINTVSMGWQEVTVQLVRLGRPYGHHHEIRAFPQLPLLMDWSTIFQQMQKKTCGRIELPDQTYLHLFQIDLAVKVAH